MTDNEKRAHDFALCLLNNVIEAKQDMIAQEAFANASKEEINSGNITIKTSIDAYTEYLALYTHVLESFNRDFPDGK